MSKYRPPTAVTACCTWELTSASCDGGAVSDHTVLRPTISAFGNWDRNIARALMVAASNWVFDCPKSLLLPSTMMRSGWRAATELLTPTRVSAHWLGLPETTNPASSQPRSVTSQPLAREMTFGQASAGVSPQPLMIESPIVSTCRGATGTSGAGGVTEGVAVELGVPVLPSFAAEVVVVVGEATTPVDDDRAIVVENNPATVMSEPAATVARTIAIARDHLGVGEADIGLQLFHQSVRLSLSL